MTAAEAGTVGVTYTCAEQLPQQQQGPKVTHRIWDGAQEEEDTHSELVGRAG
jgi:hypothetical protein